MRPLSQIIAANREAAKIGVAPAGAIGTKSDVKPGFVLPAERLQKLGLDKY